MKKTALVLAFTSAILSGCGGSSDGGDNSDNGGDNGSVPQPPSVEPIAPYSISKYQAILSNSDLQQSDPEGESGNKDSIVKDGDFQDYYNDYFYAEEGTENLVFKMSNDSMRSEIRELENFDINEEGVTRTLYADVSLPGIEDAMSNTSIDDDEVTFLQIHNKSTSNGGDGIPHPLLRIVYELNRDGEYGHYWAVLKNNAVDCSGDESGSDACNNAYTRFDLGEANTEEFTPFKLNVHENNLQVSVNGITKVNQDISYWEDLLSYFKVGVYNQFDGGEAEVQFSALKLDISIDDTDSGTDPDTSYNWNIDSWKLTIPASKDDWYGSGGDNAAEIMPERCNSSNDILANDEIIEHNDPDLNVDTVYFSVEDGRMHFRADMGYGSSTENSSYIRSELRELYISSDNPDCSSSDTDTSWYLNDSRTDTSSHTLRATLKIEEHPDLSQPKVVLGQIHGWKISQALVKLLWEGDSRPVRVILNDNYETDNNSCGSCENFSVDLGTYQAGEEWSYIIRADNNGIYLATSDSDGSNVVSHTIPWGQEFKDNDGDTVILSSDWTDDDIAFYFKAGIYPQFAPEHSGEIFDVSFSNLEVDHH